MKVLILLHHRFDLWNPPQWFVERLRKEFPQLEFVHLRNYDEAESDLRDAEVLITWSLRPEQFALAKKVHWIHSPAAGVHQVLVPQLVESGVVVTNARAVHGPVVAEHAIALVLAMAKKLPQAVRCQQSHVWSQQQLWNERPRPREVAGATLALMGLGAIGSEVARRGAALGMRVIAAREHPEKPAEHIAQVFGADDADNVVAGADYLVLAVPLTSRTRGFINAERLAKMNADACLINVGRGALVDETALIEALRRKQIGGAALDVFSTEPLPLDSPLWDLENVLITPHSAAVTEQLWTRHFAQISDNLRRYLAGQPLTGLVDKRKGY